MTIKGLFKHLKSKYGKIFKEGNISKFKDKIGVVDTSSLIYKSKAAMKDRWLNFFVSFILLMKKHNIKITFIIEGKAPVRKSKTTKIRSEKRENMEEKVFSIEIAIQSYKDTGVVSDILKNITKDESRSILHLKKDIDIKSAENYCEKLKSQIIRISAEDIKQLKELFDSFGVCHISAVEESEAVAAELSRRGKIDFFITEDSDVLAHGISISLCKLRLDGNCEVVNYKRVLKKVGMKSNQFVDFCIMCGTDYNENIPGIGPVKAEKIIKEGKSLDICIKKNHNIDFDYLNYIETREMFYSPNYQAVLSNGNNLFKFYGESVIFEDEEEIDFKFDYEWNVNIEELLNYLNSKNMFSNRSKIKELFVEEEITIEVDDLKINDIKISES